MITALPAQQQQQPAASSASSRPGGSSAGAANVHAATAAAAIAATAAATAAGVAAMLGGSNNPLMMQHMQQYYQQSLAHQAAPLASAAVHAPLPAVAPQRMAIPQAPQPPGFIPPHLAFNMATAAPAIPLPNHQVVGAASATAGSSKQHPAGSTGQPSSTMGQQPSSVHTNFAAAEGAVGGISAQQAASPKMSHMSIALPAASAMVGPSRPSPGPTNPVAPSQPPPGPLHSMGPSHSSGGGGLMGPPPPPPPHGVAVGTAASSKSLTPHLHEDMLRIQPIQQTQPETHIVMRDALGPSFSSIRSVSWCLAAANPVMKAYATGNGT